MAPNGSIWRATEAFWANDASGMPVRVDKGDLLREGHELIQSRPGSFELYEPKLRFEDVEEATAEPVPRRRGRPPKTTEIAQEATQHA